MGVQRTGQTTPLVKVLGFTVALSAIVLFEPAPYDFLLLTVIVLAILFRLIHYQSLHFWPMMCLLIFLLINLIAGYFLADVTIGMRYLFISCYLMITWIGLVGVGYHVGPSLLPIIFTGYTIAATSSVLLGTIAYMGWIPQLDFLLQFGRVQGFFKDPNVFGPFLVPSTLYCLWRSTEHGLFSKKGSIYFLGFLLLVIGVLLSFSRAAWGNLFIAGMVYYLFVKNQSLKRLKTTLVLIAIVIPIFYFLITSPQINSLFQDRLGMQGYDDTRFSNQLAAVDHLLLYPLGFGPGQSEVLLQISTHSLYIRLLFETGLLGLLLFLSFYFLCTWRAIYMMRVASVAYQGYFVIIVAAFIGILFNSFFIDTLHWRHLWLLFALPFINEKLFLKERGSQS